MRLAIDAMGGDDAPRSMIQGALDYAQAHPSHHVLLVGREDEIKAALEAEHDTLPDNVHIHHAEEVIGMADKISALKEKRNDSMNVCARLVKDGAADAMVLCGNTACSVAAAQLHLRRVPGVKRAGILTPLPTVTGHTWVIDCGANAVGKPDHLAQFAEMGELFLRCYYEKERPTIGVLSIGSEDDKGDELTSETLALLRETDLNLAGNVEGNDIYRGTIDLVVCDGFTGNVVLKTSEGLAGAMMTILKEELGRSLLTKIGAGLARPAFRRVRDRTSWALVGGCLLLGVDGVTVIGHGRSDRVAVYHALIQAARSVKSGFMDQLRASMANRNGTAD